MEKKYMEIYLQRVTPLPKRFGRQVITDFWGLFFFERKRIMEKYGPTRRRFLPAHVEPFFHFQNSVGANSHNIVPIQTQRCLNLFFFKTNLPKCNMKLSCDFPRIRDWCWCVAERAQAWSKVLYTKSGDFSSNSKTALAALTCAGSDEGSVDNSIRSYRTNSSWLRSW